MLRYIMWMKSHCFATDASKVMEHLMLKYRNTWKRFHYTHTHYLKLQRTPLMAFLQVYWGSTRSSFLQVIPLWRHQIILPPGHPTAAEPDQSNTHITHSDCLHFHHHYENVSLVSVSCIFLQSSASDACKCKHFSHCQQSLSKTSWVYS